MAVEPNRVMVRPTQRPTSLSPTAQEERCRGFLPVAQKILRRALGIEAVELSLQMVLYAGTSSSSSPTRGGPAAIAGVVLAAFLNHPLPLPRQGGSLKIHENVRIRPSCPERITAR